VSGPHPRLDDALLGRVDAYLAEADAALLDRYPGEQFVRRPVHTVYVPAGSFTAQTVAQWGSRAVAVLDEHCPDLAAFARAFGPSPDQAPILQARVRAKLATEPVEDLRVDFEDGYGVPGDEQEDADAVAAGRALAAVAVPPPFLGIRFKSLEAPTRRRGLRTLDLVLGELLRAGPLPDGWVVTLPKVTSVEQVEAMVLVTEALEAAYGLPSGRLRFEVQVETSQAILGADGTALVARMVHAGAGRVTGLHYGTYDYSAGLGIAAAYQSLEHPAADHAKAVMQLAAAGTGVRVSDGSTNVMPVGSADAVFAAWQLHTRLVGRALERGYYQGWDMHPGHLPSRYAATYRFYATGVESACARVRSYVDGTGLGVVDEPATAQALAAFLVRGLHCGALDPAQVSAATGLGPAGLDALLYRRSVPGAASTDDRS
jgi:citrate lyase beta subunit